MRDEIKLFISFFIYSFLHDVLLQHNKHVHTVDSQKTIAEIMSLGYYII